MRLAALTALAATAAMLAIAGPADAQQRRGYQAQPQPRGERITIIDENGRVRTKITVRRRSYLDGGTEVVPGERKFMDYANNPTYSWSAPTSAWDPNGIHRFPLPMPFELPNFNPYTNY